MHFRYLFVYLQQRTTTKKRLTLCTGRRFVQFLFAYNLNEYRMKQVEERYISLLTDFGFDRLFEEAEIAKFTPQEVREYEASKKAYRDIKNSIDTAKNQGKEEGLAEGIEIGKKEGRKEGRIEANTETAQRLLAMGLSAEQVAEATQLPLDIIEKLSRS